MMEWGLILCGGLLGSAHCVGMCGGFALILGSGTASWQQNLWRQLNYSIGRIFTYVCAGAVAGYSGWRLTVGGAEVANIQAVLAFIAGVVLVWQGLISAGWLPKVGIPSTPILCGLPQTFSAFLRSAGWFQPFLAGMFTGLLPCGLLYGYLLLAASSGNLSGGAVRMLAFGLGTVPLMVLAGIGGQHLLATRRRWMWKLAAWCVVATGLLSISRGLAGWPGYSSSPGTCPFCQPMP